MAKQALDDFKPQAATERLAHLKALAKAIALRKDTTEETEFKKLTNQALQRKTGAKLRAASKKGRKGLATKLLKGPEQIPVEDKLGLETTSAEENEPRFTSCIRATEFLYDDILLNQVGILCDGPAVDPILAGTWEPPNHLQDYTKMVLQFLPTPDKVKHNPMPPINLTKDDHIRGWQKVKERTSSDPRDLDFSHYISASYDEVLAEMDHVLREVPLQCGFAPDEWNPMADCSIPKKEDVLQADKMRTTVLMSAQYNMNNKWYGRASL